MSLPPFTNKPVPANGTMAPVCIVIHRAENAPSNGSGLAAYCYNNPGTYRWHWSVGSGGQAFKHLDWNEEGIHSAGLNDFAAGIEQDGRSAIDPWPEAQLRTTAAIVADFCEFIGKAPSRDFIIGHVEDYKFGGTSTHTDPGTAFPWSKFMDYVNEAYEGEEDWMALFDTRQEFEDWFRKELLGGLTASDLKSALEFVRGQQKQVGGGTPTGGAQAQGHSFAAELRAKT